MKKLINDADAVVRESLEGRVLLQPNVSLLGSSQTVVRTDRVVNDDNRATVPVALISGGGAGHEPAHAGYVAHGMLTAAVSGGVFASPSVDAVLDAIRAVTGDAGCLLIVKSYTGDRLNFGMAAELARHDGLNVEMVVVGDDVALSDDDTHAGRRGLAGTVLVHKVAGAAAESGSTLREVHDVATRVTGHLGTMGVALAPCTTPGADAPSFELGDDEIELGLGIHGEPGVERTRLTSADDIAQTLVGRILDDLDIVDGDRVVALVGTAGATPPSELDIVARGAHTALTNRGVVVERLWAGPVLTSLDMSGAHVSLLPVDDGLLDLLDTPTASPAWPGFPDARRPALSVVTTPESADRAGGPKGEADPFVRQVIDAACERLLRARTELDAADQHVGDGDLGSALARGARAWLDDPAEGDAASLLQELSARCRRAIGGTSGPLYGMLLLRAAQALADGASWGDALRAGVTGVRELGGAQPGDGTMVDALEPAADAADSSIDAVVTAAREGATRTSDAVATKGRASYLGERAKGYEDPGATAVVMWLEAVREAMSQQ